MVVRSSKKQDNQRSICRPKKCLFLILFLVVLSRQQDYYSVLSQEGLSALLYNSSFEDSTEIENDSYLIQREAAERLLQQMSAENKTIRSWGCNRKESPLIFVHIGKSGGGTTRARFAAAALNFTREKWWNFNGDNHYYPMPTRIRFGEEWNDDASFSRGTFCSSTNNNRRMLFLKKFANKGFEQIHECNGKSPLARFVGCPAVFRKDQACKGCSNLSDAGCYAVYAGHNPLGSELHWLSAPFLQDWWSEKWGLLFPFKTLASVQSITPDTTNPYWCQQYNASRPTDTGVSMIRRPAHRQYYDCSKMVSIEMDRAFLPSWNDIASKFGMEKNYAPFYASLPMHRTVVLRESFSWLMSRFFWAKEYHREFVCDDIPNATKHATLTFDESGWAYQVVLEALLTLCGEDCINRSEVEEMGLEEIEQQAESNLRHSFSVVGLLNETESFYEMVTTRIQYSNMSNNPHVIGPTHMSIKNREQRRCKERFMDDETFRDSFRAALPHFEALERLYKVGLEVNRFQKQELQQCKYPEDLIKE